MDENFSIATLVHNPTAHPLSETSHMPQSVSGYIVYDQVYLRNKAKQSILDIMYYYSDSVSCYPLLSGLQTFGRYSEDEDDDQSSVSKNCVLLPNCQHLLKMALTYFLWPNLKCLCELFYI